VGRRSFLAGTCLSLMFGVRRSDIQIWPRFISIRVSVRTRIGIHGSRTTIKTESRRSSFADQIAGADRKAQRDTIVSADLSTMTPPT